MKHFKTIDDFLSDIDEEKLLLVQELRALILDVQPELIEHIKWNAISFVYLGVDRITFNVVNKQNQVMLIFHMGAQQVEDKKAKPTLNDPTGLMNWISNIRGSVGFSSLEEIQQKEIELRKLIELWLNQV